MSEDILKKYTKDKELTHESTIEGLGTVKVWGTLDIEKLIKRFLKSSSMIKEESI